MWIFGYGSLVWKTGFPFSVSHAGYIDNYARRFWQGSIDHRGVPDNPGRVVTLIRSDQWQHFPDEEFAHERSHDTFRTYGSTLMKSIGVMSVVYKIEENDIERVTDYLDFREKGGYSIDTVTVHILELNTHIAAKVYIAGISNPQFIGPATSKEIAKHILSSEGPSGKNLEYFECLYEAMKNIHPLAIDQHLESIYREIKTMK